MVKIFEKIKKDIHNIQVNRLAKKIKKEQQNKANEYGDLYTPTMSISEVEKAIEEYKTRYEDISKDCLSKGNTWEEMIEKNRDNAYNLFELDKDLRMLKSPEIIFGKKWNGVTYTLKEFISLCERHVLFDSDEHVGYYATEKGKSDIKILPSDILEKKYRTDFSHVIWI